MNYSPKVMKGIGLFLLAFSAFLLPSQGVAANQMHTVNDYPTVARSEYVFACMVSNGQSQQVLEKCSCSIDVIASIIPYNAYVEAETVMRMRLMSGEKGAVFRTGPGMKDAVANLKRAQAEGEIRCF